MSFKKDFLASVVVFLVALPLCMGIAIASGIDPAAGLITGIVGGLVVGFIAGSPLQVSGPAAGLAVIVWELVQKYGVEALGIIVFLAGVFQLIAGIAKLGQWFRAISPAVIQGMLGGIGVLIFASQFHLMLDDKPRGSGIANLLAIPDAILKGLFPPENTSHHLAAIIGALTIASIVSWNRFKPESLKSLPGPLVGVLVATGVSLLFKMPIVYVAVPDSLIDSIRLPSNLQAVFSFELIGAALAMAFVASAESLLCATAVDQLHAGQRTNYDKELTAQGIGNIICGIAGALPMTGVIVRSSANVQSGAVSRNSTILHGVWLLVFSALFPQIIRLIPISALAAILVYTGYKLVNPANIRKLQSYGIGEVVIYFATLLGIVGLDLLRGVIIGVVLATLKLLHSISHLEIREEYSADGQTVDVYLKGSATFLTLPKLASALEKLSEGRSQEGHGQKVHIEDLTFIDHACLELLQNWGKRQLSSNVSATVEWQKLEQLYYKPSLRKVS